MTFFFMKFSSTAKTSERFHRITESGNEGNGENSPELIGFEDEHNVGGAVDDADADDSNEELENDLANVQPRGVVNVGIDNRHRGVLANLIGKKLRIDQMLQIRSIFLKRSNARYTKGGGIRRDSKNTYLRYSALKNVICSYQQFIFSKR